MHVYIYDSFLAHKKYDRVLATIETRITDLGLNGKIDRLGPMKNIKSMVENEIKRGVKTIVAVGNDHTVNEVINAITAFDRLKLYKNVPLGIIPIGKENNVIAESLGINGEEDACNILSARRIEELDLGLANNRFFLLEAAIASQGTTIEINQTYSIEIMDKGEISIINLPNKNLASNKASFSPQDGILELLIRTKKSGGFLKIGGEKIGESVFSLKKLAVHNNKNQPIILDGCVEIPAPAEISVIREKIKIIVGKERNF
jgi:diacylglycerol kinase family enzyme